MNLGYLEPTRHHRLKDTFRVVLLRCSADFLNVLLAIAFKRLLGLAGVVEIDPRMRLPNALSVGLQIANEPVTFALEDVVILWAVVGKVVLKH